MGLALVVMTVPEENLTLDALRVRDKETGAFKPFPKEEKWKPRSWEDTIRAYPDAEWLLAVKPGDVWILPREPVELHGRDWHFTPEYVTVHKAHVRRSLTRFLNSKLAKLEGMVRTGWMILQRVRVATAELEVQAHGPNESPRSARR